MSDLDDDIQTLKDLRQSYIDENAELDNELVRMQKEVEEQTSESVGQMQKAGAELDALEEEAEKEENQGQIAQVQQNISNM